MKLIIDIPEDVYNDISNLNYSAEYFPNALNWAIRNGTPYEERPKGEWKAYATSASGCGLTIGIKCPFCGYRVDRKYDFCVCGADMRGEQNDK